MGRSKAPLVLMEQLAMLLVFAIAAAAALQAFVHAGLGSRRMEQDDLALSACSIFTEAVRAEDISVFERYGIRFEPGSDVPRQDIQDGSLFESAGLSVAVRYDLSDRYVWTAEVTVCDQDGDTLLSLPVAGQKGGGTDG